MGKVTITEENDKEDFIEVFAETTLEEGDTRERRFKFNQSQMKDGTYRDVLKGWANELHEEYDEVGDRVGDEIQF